MPTTPLIVEATTKHIMLSSTVLVTKNLPCRWWGFRIVH